MISFLKKETLQFVRDKAIFFFVLYAFTLDIYMAGKGFVLTLSNAGVALFDMDKTKISREIARRIRPPYFKHKGEVRNNKEAIYLLDTSKVLGVIVIPPDFERKIMQKRSASFQVMLDGTQITSSTLAAAYIGEIVKEYSKELSYKLYGIPSSEIKNIPKIDERSRVLFNPNLEDSYFTALNELFMVVTMISIILSATALVRERDYGTIEQLLVSPIEAKDVVISKVTFTVLALLIMTQISIIFVLKGVFNIPLKGSYLLFNLITAFYIFSSCGIGLLIATLAERLSEVGLLTILFLAPILFLSGGWVPSEAMPSWLVPLTYFSPLKYYTELGLGVYLRGEGLTLAWKEFLALGLIGSLYFLFGFLRFRKMYR